MAVAFIVPLLTPWHEAGVDVVKPSTPGPASTFTPIKLLQPTPSVIVTAWKPELTFKNVCGLGPI